jgi:hypothetical protein
MSTTSISQTIGPVADISPSSSLDDDDEDDDYFDNTYSDRLDFYTPKRAAEIIRFTDLLLTEDAETLSIEDGMSVLDILRYWHGQKNLEGAEKAQQILDRCLGFNAYDIDGPLKMSTAHWTIVIDAWTKSGHPDSAQKANDLITRMDKAGMRFNRVTWNTWIRSQCNSASSRTNKDGVIDAAKNLLRAMEDDIGSQNMQINDYNILLGLYAKQGRALEAEKFLKDLVDRYNDGQISCRPDLCSYNSLMDAWANAEADDRNSSIGVRAEMILDEVERRIDEWASPADSRTYVPAIRAVARSGEDNIMDRVLAINKRALSRGVKSNAYMISALLDAYATTAPHDGIDKLDDILEMADQLEDEGSIGSYKVRLTAVYNSALKLLTRCRDDHKSQALAKGEEIFSKMILEDLADAVSYSTMVTLYGVVASGGRDREKYAAKVERLLTDLNEDPRLGPNSIVQNAAMKSFVHFGMIPKATELLGEMEESYYRNKGPLIPSTISYVTIMSAWAKSSNKNKVQYAEEIFQRMLEMHKSGNTKARPNFISVVVLVDAIVKSDQDGAAEKAEKIVLDMYESYKTGESTIKPNTMLVTSVIDCWNRSGESNAGERAEALLDWLIQTYKEQDMDEDLMPNEFSFAAAISAWSRSRKFGKAFRAKAILDKMVAMSESGSIKAAPNSYCYTSVINSCAYCIDDSVEKRDSLQVFVDVYKQMNTVEDMELSHVTFATVLLALRNLLEPGEKRSSAARTVFKKVIEKGLCSVPVLNRLKSVVDGDEFRDIVGRNVVGDNGFIDLQVLPADWTCNVKQQDSYKTRRVATAPASKPSTEAHPIP